MDFELRDRVKRTLKKSHSALNEARILYSQDLLPGTISRAYSSIFHSAAAVLMSEDFDIFKPSALVSFFNREIVKRDLIEPDYYKMFVNAHECYQAAEFDAYIDINPKTAGY
ncbi:MAG TPA: HEPN domain-containing protein, partial [Actinobacteria bacterium]|nr:HEPN domain-containing protein [Actinomycetes bacterium]HEX21379.1 HEPN domain-containing protein [Actinomycetota bacterium]